MKVDPKYCEFVVNLINNIKTTLNARFNNSNK